MKVITAPEPLDTINDLFLAGGISNCKDWQQEAIEALADVEGIVLNPRRDAAILTSGEEAKNQIVWEHNALRNVQAILFWFPKETLCPITLLELGSALERDCPLFIGTDPDYQRRFDVETQVQLSSHASVVIHDSLATLLTQYAEWNKVVRAYNYGLFQ